MTDAEKWALNREIAEAIEPSSTLPTGYYDPDSENLSHKIMWYYAQFLGWRPRDFAGDLNAAWEMGERLREMGLKDQYLDKITDQEALSGWSDFDLLQAPALVRAQAAAEVLRERGKA